MFVFGRRLIHHFDHVVSRKKKVPFSMAIENGELVHEILSQTLAQRHSKNELR